MRKNKQNLPYDKEALERYYGLTKFSPKEKAGMGIKRIKIIYSRHDLLRDVEDSGFWWYLWSESCELTWEQKDFLIYCGFAKEHEGYAGVSLRGDIVISAFERWGIIDAFKLYNNDEKAGIKWFESHKIPMQHVYLIINSKFFDKEIVRKYPDLKSLPTKYSQNKCKDSVNSTGRVSRQQYAKSVTQAIELLQKGDYDKSHYDLLKLIGSEKITNDIEQSDELYEVLRNRLEHIKTKSELIKFLDLIRELGWAVKRYNVWRRFFKHEDFMYMRKILGVKEGEENIRNFDLKNSEDIARCKELFPLVIEYPFLFPQWYYDGYVNGVPSFVPEYDNALEKKRKELHFKLASKGVLGKIAAETIVPKRIGIIGRKLEQVVSNMVFKKKEPGRGA